MGEGKVLRTSVWRGEFRYESSSWKIRGGTGPFASLFHMLTEARLPRWNQKSEDARNPSTIPTMRHWEETGR